MPEVDNVFTSDELEHICYELAEDGWSGEMLRLRELIHGWHQLQGSYRIEAVVPDEI